MARYGSFKTFKAIRLNAITLFRVAAILTILLLLIKPDTTWAQQAPRKPPNLPESKGDRDESSTPSTIRVQKIEVVGSTVFGQDDFDPILKSYQGRDLTLDELFRVRSQITQLYIDRGYITSGAYIPAQRLTGIVKIFVIEGTVPKINVEGTQRINPDYVRFRVQLGVKRPFNHNEMINQLQSLGNELLFKDIQAEINAGKKPGESVLNMRVTEVDYARIVPLIKQLTGDQGIEERLKESEIEKRRLNAIKALVQIGSPAAIDASLGKIGIGGKAAVPSLIADLKDADAYVRSSAALLLGKIGIEAKAAIPNLAVNLKDSSVVVQQYAVSALKSIAISLHEKVDTLSLIDLNQDISNLQVAVDVVQAPQTQFSTEQVTDLSFALEALKNKRNQRIFNNEILKNPWLWGGGSYIVLLLGIFLLHPLWLLKLYELLKPIGFKLPVLGADISLGVLLFPKYHSRVLDAWVAAHIKSVREDFWEKDAVHVRRLYIPTPVVLNGNTIAQLNSSHLRSKFAKRRCCVLIWGEGGIGKTSLAVQIAKWAMSDDATERLCQHRMLPVLIEEELNSDADTDRSLLMAAIRGQLQDLTNETNAISEELLERLLREQRVLVVVDHFSEMNDTTRKAIRPELPDFPVNALVVTSRLEEKLGQVTKTTLKPLRIEGNRLSSFIEAYLNQRGKRDQFTDVEFFDACRHLSKMMEGHHITVLLAKLYAEQLITAKEGISTNQLPETVPDLMLAYLNELNRNVTTERLSDRIVHQDAKVLAWECLKKTYQPTAISRENAIKVLSGDNAESRLKYLEDRLRLIQNIPPAQDKIRFTLDPLAEYLAGLHLVHLYGKNENAWHELLSQVAAISETPTAIQGFLLALLDCCLVQGKEGKVPDFVVEELSDKAQL